MKQFALALAAALLITTAAFATDGVVLINQNTVINGLPGCPTGGSFPIIICKSGSYKLSGNLTVSGFTDAIDITARNVSLDLNGFTISGIVVCDGTPITAPTSCTVPTYGDGIKILADGATIRNGTVRGFWDGVYSYQGALIEELHAVRNNNGIFLGSTGTVRRSVITDNGAGINLYGGGLIVHDTVTANEGNGVYASAATIANNTSSYNGGYGIVAAYGSTVLGNSATKNGLWGLAVENSLFGSNTVYDNARAGIPNSGSISQQNNMCDGTGC